MGGPAASLEMYALEMYALEMYALEMYALDVQYYITSKTRLYGRPYHTVILLYVPVSRARGRSSVEH